MIKIISLIKEKIERKFWNYIYKIISNKIDINQMIRDFNSKSPYIENIYRKGIIDTLLKIKEYEKG